MNERRSVGRTKIVKDALLFFGEQTGVRSCAVTDITNAGAGIWTLDLSAMPLNLELCFDKFRTTENCSRPDCCRRRCGDNDSDRHGGRR